MKVRRLDRSLIGWAGSTLAVLLFTASMAAADEPQRSVLVLTTTNDPAANELVVFKLQTSSAPALTFVEALPTGGEGGASTNAGILQFAGDLGAVANYGSNSVSRIVRYGDDVGVAEPIKLAPGCLKPDSVALGDAHLYVVGATCAESHSWPSGTLDGATVALKDPSAAQIAVGRTWGAVTLSSGSVLQLQLTPRGALNGLTAPVPLPSDASSVPLGAAFWRDVLGFTPAHSPNSFAIVDAERNVYPILGPAPPYPSNAPCWVAKGPGNAWYTGNSPGQAISIFFTDDRGGVFYKSIALPGVPTDVAVSADRKWLAAIYTASGNGYVAVFAINAYGDLALAATSEPVGIAGFNGVAMSE